MAWVGSANPGKSSHALCHSTSKIARLTVKPCPARYALRLDELGPGTLGCCDSVLPTGPAGPSVAAAEGVAAGPELVVFNWPDDLAPAVIAAFEAASGARVRQVYFETDGSTA